MKKTIDKAISLLIVCCIMVSQCLVICSAQEINAPVFRLIDEAHGIYQRVNQSRSSNSNDDKLIRYNGQYYIQLEDTLYAQAQRLVFTSSSSLTSLKPETQNVVRSVFNWANANETDLVGGTVEVFTPINEELISQSSVFASDFPVTNEQVRYVAVGNEQVIASGNNTFQTYPRLCSTMLLMQSFKVLFRH